MSETYHIPALLPEVIDALDVRADGTYVDVTFGGGGHSRAIIAKLGPAGHLYAFDQDEEAAARAIADPRFTMVLSNFRFLRNWLRFHSVESVDGILGDLGVSFHHFDDPSRGFSFRWEGPLDMRMNRHAGVSAATLLSEADADRLARIFSLYGELRNARAITSAIVRARAEAPVDTVERLLQAVKPLLNPRQEKKDLACIFQALRIEVNDEMGALRSMLTQALQTLRPGGRLAVITYHSLEDRLVKNFMRSGNFDGRVEQDFYGRRLSPLRPLTSRPIVPGEDEIAANPRSRSAKLRVAVKQEIPQ